VGFSASLLALLIATPAIPSDSVSGAKSHDTPTIMDEAEWRMLRRLYFETAQSYQECLSSHPDAQKKCEQIRLYMENYKKLTSGPPP
jgi:hypothetical protein